LDSWIHRTSPGIYLTSLEFIGLHRNSSNFIGIHRTSLNFIGLHLEFIWFYRNSSNFSGIYEFIGLHRTLLDFIGFHRILSDFIGLRGIPRTSSDFIGLHRTSDRLYRNSSMVNPWLIRIRIKVLESNKGTKYVLRISSKVFYGSFVIQRTTLCSLSIDMDEAACLLIYARFQMENHAWIGFARELK